MPFSGQLSLGEDDRPLEADVDFVGSELTISTIAGQIWRWPLESCRIQPDSGRFLITVEDETAWFAPDEPVLFTRLVLEHWGASSLASAMKAARAASEPRKIVVPEPEPEVEAERPKLLEVLAGLEGKRKLQIGAAMAALILVLLVASMAGGEPLAPVTLGTVATTTTIPAIPFVFQGGLDGVAGSWNEAAEDLGLDMFLVEVTTGNRLQTLLLGNVVLYGTEHPDTGNVRTLMVAAGPATGDEGTAVLAVWGNLIAVVSPELDPEGRRAVLERLGVDLDRPLTLGLNTETTEAGARYWLRSGVLNGRVLFGVEPNSG